MSGKERPKKQEKRTGLDGLQPHEVVGVVVNTAVAASHSLPAVAVAAIGDKIAILIDGWTLDAGGNPVNVAANGGKPDAEAVAT